MKRVSKKPANDTIVVGMIGITKIFVGEIVETGKNRVVVNGFVIGLDFNLWICIY